MAKRKTSRKLSKLAGETLADPKAKKREKRLAASVLSQTEPEAEIPLSERGRRHRRTVQDERWPDRKRLIGIP